VYWPPTFVRFGLYLQEIGHLWWSFGQKKQFQHFHILGRCTCDLPTSQYVMGQQSDLQNITVFIIFLSSLYLITSYISALYPYISYIIIIFLNLIFLNQTICSGVTAKIRVRHFSNFHTITSSFDVSNQKCNGDPGTIVRHFGFTWIKLDHSARRSDGRTEAQTHVWHS